MNDTPFFEHSETDTLQSTFLQSASVFRLGPGFIFFEQPFTPGPGFVLRKYRGNLLVLRNTGLFEMIVGVLTTCHTQYTRDRSMYLHRWIKIFSKFSFMFLLFPQVSRNWRYESEPPLKPSPLTCYKQFGTNSIIVLMLV